MTEYTITHIENENRFIITNEKNQEMGKLLYILEDEKSLNIHCVVVDPAFGGKGLGSKLVAEVLKYAKEKNIVLVLHVLLQAVSYSGKTKKLNSFS